MTDEQIYAINQRLDPGWSYDQIMDQLYLYRLGAFTFIIQDSGEKHHGNCRLWVLNAENQVIDDRTYYNAVEKDISRPMMTYGFSVLVDSREVLK